MVVSIHQPNFFPWMPFFQKMEQSDVFVILSHCQFEKNGYQNRFKLGDKWHTMSVGRGLFDIKKKEYTAHFDDWKRIKTNLPQYNLEEFNLLIERSLLGTNTSIITRIAYKLGISTDVEIVQDFETSLTGTERLVEICQQYDATKYLSGISGKKYLDLKLFEQAGIEVIFQNEIQMIKKPILEVIC